MKLQDYTSASQVLAFQAAIDPTTIAIVFADRAVAYAELEERAVRVAAKLVEAGIRPGDHVSILAKNTDRFYECFFGILKAGAIVTPLNWRLVAEEVDFQIADADVKFVFFETALDGLLVTAREQRQFQDQSIDRGTADDYEDWLAGASAERPQGLSDPDAPVLQVYTAGTTGRPKGALLTNRNLTKFCDLDQPDIYPDWWQVRPEDVSLLAVPIFHIGGLEVSFRALFSGGRIILHREFNPVEVLQSITRYRPTLLNLVPTALQMVLRAPGAAEVDFSCLRVMAYGGSPIPVELLREALALMQCDFVQAYGMSETTSTVVALPPEDNDPAGTPRMLAAGKPLARVELRIVDGAGTPLPTGSDGEILIRAPSVMKGYWNNAAATAGALDAEGWLHSGDIGHIDADGYLFISGRLKEMIISGGENISPVEVENAIFGHPSVAEVAVIGVPHEKWGEAVKALVVLKPGAALDEDDIIAWARRQIAGYKVPRSIDAIAEIPKNAAGKILKAQLKAPYWQGVGRAVN